jgi:hypothetical protein
MADHALLDLVQTSGEGGVNQISYSLELVVLARHGKRALGPRVAFRAHRRGLVRQSILGLRWSGHAQHLGERAAARCWDIASQAKSRRKRASLRCAGRHRRRRIVRRSRLHDWTPTGFGGSEKERPGKGHPSRALSHCHEEQEVPATPNQISLFSEILVAVEYQFTRLNGSSQQLRACG